MSQVVRILAQYFENYGFSNPEERSEHWKPKGTQEFEVELEDLDFLMYEEEEVKAVIEGFLLEQSNGACKYELIEFKPIFSKTVKLDNEGFMNRLKERLAVKYS